MIEIIQKSISAGPDGTRLPGKHRIPAEVAADLVRIGHAEYADGRPAETAENPPTPRRGRPPKGEAE